MQGTFLYWSTAAVALLVAVRTVYGCHVLFFSTAITCTVFLAWHARREHASRIRAIYIPVLLVSVVIVRCSFMPNSYPPVFEDVFNSKQTVYGTVVALPDIREGYERARVELVRGEEKMRIIASVPLYPGVHVSDQVVLEGVVREPEPFASEGGREFAYDSFLKKDGVFGVMTQATVQVIGRSASLWLTFLRMLEALRTSLVNQISATLPDPESSLALGILVGGKQGLGKELLEAFERSGMLQIVVLSGYNVMIVATVLMAFLRSLPRTVRFTVGALSMLCFVLIAGAGSSAMRAGVMAFCAMFAQTFGRSYNVLTAVCISLLALLLWNPLFLVYDPGFQFSFIATLGLVLGVPLLNPLLRFLKNTVLIELVATTLAAELMLLPLLLWQTGNLSLVSVVANVVAMPAVPFAMAASAAALVLSYPLGYIHAFLPVLLGVPAFVALAYIIRIATLFASLPFATIVLPAFPFWLVALSYVLFAIVYLRRLRRGSGARQHPSSDSLGRHPRSSSSQLACSQP